MKKFLIAAAAIVVFAAPAVAADMRMPMKAPPVAALAPPSWTGFYLGGDVGAYDSQQTGTTFASPSPGFGAPAIDGAGIAGYGVLPTAHSLNQAGVLGGIYAGYNFQIQNWLLGIEADVQGLDRSRADSETVVGSFTGQPANFPPLGTNMTLTSRNNWLASVRGRAGFLFGANNDLLVYGTGGVAFTNTRYTATFTPSTNPASLFGFGFPSPAVAFGISGTSFSQDKVGWVAGGGLEWRVGPNWFIRGEYLHYQFAGASGIVPAMLLNGAAACAVCRWTASWSDLSVDTGRIGIAYKF